MPAVTCTRCFSVFDAQAALPGVAPLCSACASRARAWLPAEPAPALTAGDPSAGRLRRWLGLAVALRPDRT